MGSSQFATTEEWPSLIQVKVKQQQQPEVAEDLKEDGEANNFGVKWKLFLFMPYFLRIKAIMAL